MNQWSGINSLAYFLPITFERNIGLSKHLSLIVSGLLGIQYFFVSWLSVSSSVIDPRSTADLRLVLTFSLKAMVVEKL